LSTAVETLPGTRSRSVRVILLGGIIAGVLDLIFAFLWYGPRGLSPMRILQSIASGLLGLDAYEGGAATASLGVALHFMILIVAAAIYYAASRRLALLRDQPVISGLLFGIAIWLVMNLIVVPWSAFPHEVTRTFASSLPHIVNHMVLVGLPIGLAVRYAK
jgi:hypothetical protein